MSPEIVSRDVTRYETKAPLRQMDPMIEGSKNLQKSIMGSFGKVFGPFAYSDSLVASKNIFTEDIQQPIKPTCYQPRFWLCHITGGGYGYQSLASHLRV